MLIVNIESKKQKNNIIHGKEIKDQGNNFLYPVEFCLFSLSV